ESKNWTALHEAVEAGDDSRVQILLFSNVDRLAKESSMGNTPLHEAASRGFSRCVKLICAPPNIKCQQKQKSRLKERVANTIEALHSNTLNILNNEGLTALHLAAQNGHNQSSRELLMAGADPDVQNKYGDTALHTACRYGHAGVTRILLSALCDPNMTNLNGDTALHITCAMGRRKLTRILLEADAHLNVKNAQGETPQSISVRKNYREINEILSTPKRMRNRREKPKDNEKSPASSGQDKDKDGVDKTINWSPYGCHYFPDPRSFPSPKLETLPKEPLKQGEQYFLDLAGHIHKGPVSVGNTCYCGPFFRHMENKLNCNRKSLKKYVHKTKERLGHKVQALAIKTNDQIEQLTRTMIEDRIRCESKRQYLNEYLHRGEPLRSTLDNQPKNQRVERTLSRCRSLDLLKSNYEGNQLHNARSAEVLENDNQNVVTVVYLSHSKENVEKSGSDDETHSNSNAGLPENCHVALPTGLPIAKEELKQSKLDELKLDFLKVSERLGDLLEKTSLIMERDNDQQNKLQLCPHSPEKSSSSIHYSPENQCSLLGNKESANSPNYDVYTSVQRRYPNSSETSNPSQNSNSWEFEASPPHNQKYYHCVERGEHMLSSVIKALRKDASFVDTSNDEALNENAEKSSEDKLLYKAKMHQSSSPSCSTDAVFHAHQSHVACHKTMSNLLKRQPLCLDDNLASDSTLYYENHIGFLPADDAKQMDTVQVNKKSANEASGKVEIKNSEIKYLKKPNTGQVKDMVAQLQGKIDSNIQNAYDISLSTDAHSLNMVGTHLETLYENPSRIPSLHKDNLRYPQQYNASERQVPKDAYFHDLPNRSRNQQRTQPTYPGDFRNARLLRGYADQPVINVTGSLQLSRHDHMDLPEEYINRSSMFSNSSSLHGNFAHSAHQRTFRGPPDVLSNEVDINGEETEAIGLYNNVSSLV
ncbi:hypothetical protein KR222_008090, partial [Zaprionus bogoriensis]